MKSNQVALSVLSVCSLLFVGCSGGSDNKAIVDTPPSEKVSLWSETNQIEAWESFNAGVKTAEEACSVYKGYDEDTKVEYTQLSALVWIDGADYKSCEWSVDWQSTCESIGQFSDGVLTTSTDEGIETKIAFKVSDDKVMSVLSVDDGEKMISATEFVPHEDTDFPPMKEISEEQANGIYKFMTETCGVKTDLAWDNTEVIQSFDPKLDGRLKQKVNQ